MTVFWLRQCIATGLDAAGKEIGQAEFPGKTYKYIGGDPLVSGWPEGKTYKDGKPMPGGKFVSLTKMASFAGPYWTPNRTAKEGALAAARWMRDTDSFLNMNWGPLRLGQLHRRRERMRRPNFRVCARLRVHRGLVRQSG